MGHGFHGELLNNQRVFILGSHMVGIFNFLGWVESFESSLWLRICARRTDAEAGWGLDLELEPRHLDHGFLQELGDTHGYSKTIHSMTVRVVIVSLRLVNWRISIMFSNNCHINGRILSWLQFAGGVIERTTTFFSIAKVWRGHWRVSF